MGGGWETALDRGQEDRVKYTIYPSEIHEYLYCPRLYFFHKYIGLERGIRERIRLLLGSGLHFIKGLLDKVRGYHVEEINERVISGVRLRGRPDSYIVEGDRLRVIERKSGRMPRNGAWISDVMQATAYTVILSSKGIRDSIIEIHYRNGVRRIRVDDELVTSLIKVLDEVIMVREHGILPSPVRGRRKCDRCRFKDICFSLDETDVTDLYEPGYWIPSRRIIESTQSIDDTSE